jgi:hypothetical protein
MTATIVIGVIGFVLIVGIGTAAIVMRAAKL